MPVIERPVTVTAFARPAVLSANEPAAVPTSPTESPPARPDRAGDPVTVAAVPPSYVRFCADSPETVNGAAVMSALAVIVTSRYLLASAPLMARPATVTVLPVPTFLFANAAL